MPVDPVSMESSPATPAVEMLTLNIVVDLDQLLLSQVDLNERFLYLRELHSLLTGAVEKDRCSDEAGPSSSGKRYFC